MHIPGQPSKRCNAASRSLPNLGLGKWRMPRPSGVQARCSSRLARSRRRWRLSWRQLTHLLRAQAVQLGAEGQKGWPLILQEPA